MRNWLKRKLVCLYESRERFLLVFLWPQNRPSRQQLEDHYADTPDGRWLLPKVRNNSAQEGSVQGRAAHLVLGRVDRPGSWRWTQPTAFFSDIFTVDKVHRWEVYGRRVIISKYFTFPLKNCQWKPDTSSPRVSRENVAFNVNWLDRVVRFESNLSIATRVCSL